jgi:hypothetical protein
VTRPCLPSDFLRRHCESPRFVCGVLRNGARHRLGHPEWWLRDDNGNLIPFGGQQPAAQHPQIDTSVVAAQDCFANLSISLFHDQAEASDMLFSICYPHSFGNRYSLFARCTNMLPDSTWCTSVSCFHATRHPRAVPTSNCPSLANGAFFVAKTCLS